MWQFKDLQGLVGTENLVEL